MADTEIASRRLVLLAAADRQIKAMNESPQNASLLELVNAPTSNSQVVKFEPTFNATELLEISEKSGAIDQLRKETNIEKAIAYSEATLRNQEAIPPTEEVDMDWFFRWRECAGGMSSNDLQQIWGHVLAGEIKAPGSFDFRTLDFLRSLSRNEAKLIEHMAGFVTETYMLVHSYHKGSKLSLGEKVPNFLTDSETLLLEELGILGGVSTMGFNYMGKPAPVRNGRYSHLIACKGRGIVATTDDPNRLSGLGFYRLTKLGLSVLELVETVPNEKYLLSLAQSMASTGFSVQLGDVVSSRDGNSRSFANGMDVAPPPQA